MPQDKKEWNSLVSTLPVVERRPRGFISITDFAERCQVSQPSIRQAVIEQRIPKRFCVAVIGRGRDQRKQVYINWNETGYRYILSRPPDCWPDDFSPNPRKEYLPIVVMPSEGDVDLTNASVGDKVGGATITDLPAAKLEFELLKIKKLTAEVQQINNETISMKDSIDAVREAAVELRALIQTMLNRLPPKLAAEKTIVGCRRILRDGITAVFDQLEDMYNGETSQKSNDPNSIDDSEEA